MGVIVGDYNQDGKPDLYLTNAGPNQLFTNLGGGKFRDDSRAMQVEGNEWSVSAAWADFDRDGDLDLYMYAEGVLLRNDGDDVFTDVRGIIDSRPMQICRGAAWGDLDGDGLLDLYITGYENWDTGHEWHDVIFRNNGGKSFTNVWHTPGILRARGVTMADYDEDGDTDIYVSNYRLLPNYLWRNNGNGGFYDIGAHNGTSGDGANASFDVENCLVYAGFVLHIGTVSGGTEPYTYVPKIQRSNDGQSNWESSQQTQADPRSRNPIRSSARTPGWHARAADAPYKYR